MSDGLRDRVDLHHRALFGDPDNIKEQPGVIADIVTMSVEQERTNEILTEVRNGILCIVALVMTGFVTALLTIVYKH